MAAKVKFVTPIGIAKYPWLTKPDTQFDPDGVYTTQLILGVDDALDLVELIKSTATEEFGSKSKFSLPIQRDEETGDFVIKVKSKFQPKYFDGTGEVIEPSNCPPLFGGSSIRLKGIVNPYTMGARKGVSLQLTAVQVIEPVSGGGGDSDGFDAVEGGYKAAVAKDRDDAPVDDGSDDDFDF